MDEPLAVALKFGFLVVLYLFLLWVVRSAMRDLARYGGSAAAAEPVEVPSPARRDRRDPPDLREGVARACTWLPRWGTSRVRRSMWVRGQSSAAPTGRTSA